MRHAFLRRTTTAIETTVSPQLRRWIVAVVLVLAVPIVPFIGLGDRLNAHIANWFHDGLSTETFAAMVVSVLVSDILLPVPSSFVSTLAGARLGGVGGTAVSWLGMTAGSVLGFALAWWCGHALARRLATPEDLASMEALTERHGPAILVFTRALPVLAEATVLLLGAMRLPWRRFLPPVVLANLGLAIAYSALGHWAGTQNQLPLALAASIALPVLAATIARWRMKAGNDEGRNPNDEGMTKPE